MAQSQLYEMYAPVLYAICLRYCSCSQDAEDCLHDGIVKIFDNIKNYSGKGSFEGWMKRIIINQCIDASRKKVNFLNVENSEIVIEDEINEFKMLPDERLFNAICNLPPTYKIVFNMYAIEDMKHKEIAQILGISESSSRSNYLRARKILRVELKLECVRG